MVKNLTTTAVVCSDLRKENQPNAVAYRLLVLNFPDWLSDRLRSQMTDALRGLNKRMAKEVAYDFVDYWLFGVRHFTGIQHIDTMLQSMYNKVNYCASKQGIELTAGN
jgi:hypothetical protein